MSAPLRITIAEGDYFDCHFPPFEQLSVADHIRIFEGKEEEGLTPLDTAKNRLVRITGAPERFIRHLTEKEVERANEYVSTCIGSHNDKLGAMATVNDTLEKWKEEHDGKDWTAEDAKTLVESLGIFRPSITHNSKTYTAIPLGGTYYGQWIDLQHAVAELKDAPESELYARALAILMHGEDGSYPVQGNDESDHDYSKRANAYTHSRIQFFLSAPWVDVMGCAAFFFSNVDDFALICSHSMKLFRSLRGRNLRPERRVIPIGGEFGPS